MKHYLLFYEVCENYVEKRAAFRDAHLRHCLAATQRNELLLAGALADPVDRAVLLFQGTTSAGAQRFAEQDPYVVNGLVPHWRIREWTTVAGPQAATPLTPGSP